MTRTNPSRDRAIGRRPGDPEDTRQAILTAAREVFSEVGFERGTIRAIAGAAEVDPALVIHHFRSKQNLFAAAHELPFDPSMLLAAVVEAPPEQRGELLARTYLATIMAPSSPALSLLRAATTNEQAASMLREFIADVFLVHAPELAPGANSEERLALAGSQLIGLVIARELIGLAPLADAATEELIQAVAPTVQAYLDGT